METTTIYSDHYPRVRQEDLVSLKVLHVLISSFISTGRGFVQVAENLLGVGHGVLHQVVYQSGTKS